MSESTEAAEALYAPLRETPLQPRHAELGASFTDFGGWSMPVRYTSDLAEHHAVRQGSGLFDISHMAEFVITGAVAGDFLDYALAGRLSVMKHFAAKYSLVLAASGGIVDDVIVYRLGDEKFLIIANAGNHDVVATELAARAEGWGVNVEDISDDYALIAVQGPTSRAILEATAGITKLSVPLDELKYYAAADALFGGEPLLIARTGYTGEDGFELLIANGQALALWDALRVAGADHALQPAGLAARDTLRLEAGMPLYGHELSYDVTPAQVGLGRVVVTAKESFVGKDALDASADAPVLVGLVSEGRRAGRAGYEVYAGDQRVGLITSGALSPTLGHPIAMALVHPDSAEIGTVLDIDVRGTRIPATVTALPFYRRTA